MPEYLQICRDITDLEEFKTRKIASLDYKFKPEDEV